MADSPLFAPLTAPVVRPLRWVGLALATLVAAIGARLRLQAGRADAICDLHHRRDVHPHALALERLLCALDRPRRRS